ncbi:DUF6538 domain-containing protein [Amaricoccus tamworthensis]|uniref:DUF6538 domain-containing protein n=1 Tax=Amaricoccus tamworthensis TaxID=57002 RepID=UPI003C7B78F4
MSIVVAKLGAFTLMADHIYQKKAGGRFYFRRRIPDDVVSHYPGKKRPAFIVFSLKTNDPLEAGKKATRAAIDQDALWKAYRSGDTVKGPEEIEAATELLRSYGLKSGDAKVHGHGHPGLDPFYNELSLISVMMGGPEGDHELQTKGNGHDYLPPVYRSAAELLQGQQAPVFLSRALAEYMERHEETESHGAGRDRTRVVMDFIKHAGDLPVDQYSRTHANQFIRYLNESRQNAKSTIRRRLVSLRPVLKEAIREHELEDRGIFDKVVIPATAKKSKERLPFTASELNLIQRSCLATDDDIRWLVSILSDTGMRMAEAVGLMRNDVFLNDPIPYVHVQQNALRGIKNAGSNRRIPLVGGALWAVKKALGHSENGCLFPRYVGYKSPPHIKATHASNTINKWIRSFDLENPRQKSAHSFRHSLADRLRAVKCSEEIRHAIGGWATANVGQSYGEGFPLSVLVEYMNQITILDWPIDTGIGDGNGQQ